MVRISDYDQPPNPAVDNFIIYSHTLPKINTINNNHNNINKQNNNNNNNNNKNNSNNKKS